MDDGRLNATALKLFEAWDREQGWSAAKRPHVDYADTKAWPELRGPAEGWDTGLKQPRVVVVSMRQRTARRANFKKQFEGAGWKLGAQWAAAIDGSAMPVELRWLKGYEDKKSWDANQPGNWGCYLSHLAVMRDSQVKCPGCDLMVFEDDAVFVPKFKERWASFFEKVPKDWSLIRLGGQSLWSPSFEVTTDYVHARAVANTWGYVVKGDKVKRLADLLAGLPVRGSWGIDAVFQLFSNELKMYAPAVPLVQAVGSCSDSSAKEPGKSCNLDTPGGMQQRIAELHSRWPQGYVHTYCQGRGVLNAAESKNQAGCEDVASETCCPYKDPPIDTML